VEPAEPVPATYWSLAALLGTDAPDAAEAVTNFLWELGAIGVVEEGVPAGVRLRAFFPPGVVPERLEATVRAYLAELGALGVPGVSEAPIVLPLADEPWAEAWRAHFRPIAVGERFLVCPPWNVPPPAEAGGREVLLLEPGRAFGTGSHGSTHTCLELLARALGAHPVPRALDVGCGSGILAIAAARLGVEHVDAIDVDPDAIAATRDNAARNAVADRIDAIVSAVEQWARPAVPLVCANLLASTHLALALTLARLTAPGGRLIVGGLLAHEVPVVTGAFAGAGCWVVEVTEREGWAALLLARGAGEP
jgi:ribosomal protein L11 methyltransferase